MAGDPGWCGLPREGEYPPGRQLCLDDYPLPSIAVSTSFVAPRLPICDVPTSGSGVTLKQATIFDEFTSGGEVPA